MESEGRSLMHRKRGNKRGKSGDSGDPCLGGLCNGYWSYNRTPDRRAFKLWPGHQSEDTDSKSKRGRSRVEFVVQPAPTATFGHAAVTPSAGTPDGKFVNLSSCAECFYEAPGEGIYSRQR